MLETLVDLSYIYICLAHENTVGPVFFDSLQTISLYIDPKFKRVFIKTNCKVFI